jgi:transcriptional regulator with PAS, ATPase and Fis domain
MAEVVVRTRDPTLRERLCTFLSAQGCDVVVRGDSVLARDRSEDLAHSQTHAHMSALDDALVGEATQMRALKAYLATVAMTDSNVLITGETGTGKELVAQQLHRASQRRHKPFVCINCAAIPETLVESELFGYDRGAFTGATAARAGKLQQANGGTVFFDEIGEMSRFAQAKILRAIDAKEIYPLGAQRSVQLNVRVIAATNRDLEAMIRDDSFRSDLYFRLKVVRLTLPPLRERLSDIPLLVRHWLPALNATFGRRVTAVDVAVIRRLMTWSWPGNVRELKNVLEIGFLHMPPDATTLTSLHEAFDGLDGLSSADGNGDSNASRNRLGADDREQLLSALIATRWNISEAARRLRWSRMTIYRRLAKYELPITRAVTPKPGDVTASDSQ